MLTQKQSILKFKIRSLVILGVILNAVLIHLAINACYNWSFVSVVTLQCVNLLSIIKLNDIYECVFNAEL